MADQMTFKRYELKFMMTKVQKQLVQETMKSFMNPDPHPKSTIQSLYFDTPEFQLIRTSMEKPHYKEKLRLRSYGVAKEDSDVFLELKKKYDGVVYKRRERMTEAASGSYIKTGQAPKDSQIFRELSYTLSHYSNLKPAVLLSYEREAFYAKDDHEFRITFDENILWRDYDLDLKKGIYGDRVIDENLVLMEVKVANAFPLWLVRLLEGLGIKQTSFSKYATAYQAILAREAGLGFEPVTPENRVAQTMRLCHTPHNLTRRGTDNKEEKSFYHTTVHENLGGNYHYA